jgi:1-acyl-sn-glycerol-3-phosphate acyltransferase
MSDLLNKVNRAWRVLATGWSFLCFGVGGVVLGLLVFPCVNLFILKRDLRTEVARKIVRISFQIFIGLMRFLGVLRYEFKGLEKLGQGGMLVLANHPTLIDTVFLMAFVRNADCIVKSGLWNNPFTRGPVRAAAYINNEQGPEIVEACLQSLRLGNNLIIFPEGTRTPAQGEVLVKRGAANIAIRGVWDITPVVIQCHPITLSKGNQWWQVPDKIPHFSLVVQDKIKIDQFVTVDRSEVLAARDLSEYLQIYFNKERQKNVGSGN